MSGPYTLYLMDISYFSGKMEGYLRYKEIPHKRHYVKWSEMSGKILRNTGHMRVPVIQTAEGEWLQDSTPMIDWFEERHPEGPVLPEDPALAFFCRLLEDYADEWMWRPALHYRWSFEEDARALSEHFARTFLSDSPFPLSVTARIARERQRKTYVRDDGVSDETREHVEGIYLKTLDRLEAVLARSPYLLGAKPSLADFGFFASMFRHFSQDPTPARIMQDRAPGVYEWVARMWNARASKFEKAKFAKALPKAWSPILEDIGEAYLPYLAENACAWGGRRRHFDLSVQGASYKNLPTVQYRVWCRERLQDHFEALPEEAKPEVEKTLRAHGCWEPLWQGGRIASNLHAGNTPPLCRPRKVGGAERVRRYFSGIEWNLPGAWD